MRSLLLRAALAFALAGCVDLKGPSAEPTTGVGDGGPALPAVQEPTGGDGGVDAGDAGDASTDLQAELAQKRVRLADVPTTWFVSRSRVYTVDVQNKVHSFQPPNGPVVDYAFPTLSYSHFTGNDDYLVHHGDDVTVYGAASPNQVMGTSPDAPGWDVRAGSKAIGVVNPNGTGRDLLVWDPLVTSAPQKVLSFAEGGGLRFMRSHGDMLYFAPPTGVTLWTVDIAKKTAVSTSLSRTPSGLDVASAGIVAESSVGGTLAYELTADGKAPRDLTAEIMAATSVVPASGRGGVGSFSQFGDWLIYAAWGGILAFDIAQKRLVPCQLRGADDGPFLPVQVLEGPGILVFSRTAGPKQASSSQGLYYVELASVLPP